MKSKAIFVNAFTRPRYLRVCLDAISRCAGLDDWDLWVDYDGGSLADFSCCTHLKHFEVKRPVNLGPRDHPTEILRTALYFGYEKILYCDDDALFRKDMLSYMDAQPKRDGLVSAFHSEANTPSEFAYMSTSPVLIYAPIMQRIVQFMDSKEYVGLPNVCVPGKPILSDCNAHDCCWFAWCVKHKVLSYFAPKHFSLNFGYVGVDFAHHGHEARSFNGDAQEWIGNILQGALQTDAALIMGTPGFTYE